METMAALITIIAESPDSVQAINQLLQECGDHIIGRMGIPYRPAPSGKIGRLPGVSAKAAYSTIITRCDR